MSIVTAASRPLKNNGLLANTESSPDRGPADGAGSIRPRSRFSGTLYRALAFALILGLLNPLPLFATEGEPVLIVESPEIGRPIWIGDRFLGSTPVAVDFLAAGTYTLLIGEPADSTTWVLPWEMPVEIPASGTLRVRVPPLQRLQLFTPPVSAALEVDGRPMGHTPLRLLVPADRALTIVLRGENLTTQTIDYRAGSAPDSLLQVSFALAGGDPDRPLSSMGWRNRSAYLLPIGAVLAGVGGIWARGEADRAYDNYLATIDRSTMRSQLDRAGRYDDVAVSCWIAAEVLLAASAWTWLRASATPSDRGADAVRLGVTLDPLFAPAGEER